MIVILLACSKAPVPTAEVVPDPAPTEEVTLEVDTTPDTLVVPGERVGPVIAGVDRAALVAAFPDGTVTDVEVGLGEGFTAPGWRVEAGDRSLSLVVEGDELRVSDLGRAWRTAEGLGIGSSFEQVSAALGTFDIAGQGWDYSGTIDLGGSKLAEASGLLTLRLEPQGEPDPEAYQAVLGDRFFPSTDPNLAKLDLAVYEVLVVLRAAEP